MMNFGNPSLSQGYSQSQATNQYQSSNQYQSQNIIPGMQNNGSTMMATYQQFSNTGLSNASQQQTRSSGILMPVKGNISNEDFRDLLL